MEESGKRVKRVVDEGLRAIDKRTGKYVNVIKRTIDDSLFPIVKYLSYSYNELNYDYVKNLNFDVNVNWEQRRYQIVKDLLSNDFDGRKMSIDEVDNAIFTADLIINRLTTIEMVRIDFFTKKDAEYSDYMRYIIANTLQEYEGEVTLNQIPENKATEEEISKYGIEVYPTIIVSGDNMDGFNKLEGMARKADLINVMSLYNKK